MVTDHDSVRDLIEKWEKDLSRLENRDEKRLYEFHRRKLIELKRVVGNE